MATTKNPPYENHWFRGTVFIDAGAIFALTASWAHWLSELLTVVATIAAIVWYVVQISESERWRQFMRWRKEKRKWPGRLD